MVLVKSIPMLKLNTLGFICKPLRSQQSWIVERMLN